MADFGCRANRAPSAAATSILPYHSPWVTWSNRIALVLVLIGWLWQGTILPSRADYPKARSWWLWLQTLIAVLVGVCVLLFSCAVATIPGEWQANHLPYLAASTPLREWIFAGSVDDAGHRTNLLSNTLVLSGFNIYEALKIDDPKKVEWKQHLIDLRGRDLKGAWLFRAILPRADLTAAQLQGANLWGAQLQGASLAVAQLQGASLVGAQLQGADLDGARLQGAFLMNAQLQGADLNSAQLQAASLNGAQLQGANLDGARLQGASLEYAQLQGASLEQAQLRGTSLPVARLQGASLHWAQLQGANLDGAFLWRAQLQGAVPENIFYRDGKIDWGPFQGAPPFGAQLQGVSLTPWTDANYTAFREFIEHEVPEGELRNRALDRVSVLDCTKTGNTLASCDPSAPTPNIIEQWKKKIEAANVDWGSYKNAVAAILGDLVCIDDPDRIYVLRGLLRRGHLYEIDLEGSGLLKRFTSTECPVSAALTDADKRAIAALKRTKSP